MEKNQVNKSQRVNSIEESSLKKASKSELKQKIAKKIHIEKIGGQPRFLSVKLRDKILFSKHLAMMLEAGIPLREALETLLDQTSTRSLKFILSATIKDLSGGQFLGFSLARFPKVFDQFFVNVISVGESSGTLPASLKYLANQLEKTQDLQGSVRNALLYPIIVFVGALGVGAYLGFYMLPQLLPLFSSLNMKLPPTTRALLAITVWLSKNWLYFIIGVIFLFIILAFIWRLRPVKYATHRALIALPVLGKLFQEIQIMQFSRVLGILLTSGIKIVPAIHITANSLTNLVYQKKIETVSGLVERGETIGAELQKHPKLFPRTAANMVAIGERTGHLSDSLLSLAEFNEREVDTITKNLSTLIEPFVLIIIGLIVGFVALSVITPIYQLTQSVSG